MAGTAAQVTALTTGCAGSTNVIGVATGTTIGTGLAADPAKLKCCDNSVCCAAASTTDICCATGSTFAKAPATATTGQTTQVDLTAGGTPPKACLALCTTAIVTGGTAVTTTGTAGAQPVASLTCCDAFKNSCCPVGLTTGCCSASPLYVNTITTTTPPADYSKVTATPIAPSPASTCSATATTTQAPNTAQTPINSDALVMGVGVAAGLAIVALIGLIVATFGIGSLGGGGLGGGNFGGNNNGFNNNGFNDNDGFDGNNGTGRRKRRAAKRSPTFASTGFDCTSEMIMRMIGAAHALYSGDKRKNI